eukprot:1859638-Prorocentrum_lima.AAC.1
MLNHPMLKFSQSVWWLKVLARRQKANGNKTTTGENSKQGMKRDKGRREERKDVSAEPKGPPAIRVMVL